MYLLLASTLYLSDSQHESIFMLYSSKKSPLPWNLTYDTIPNASSYPSFLRRAFDHPPIKLISLHHTPLPMIMKQVPK